jgi:hypothetical protein
MLRSVPQLTATENCFDGFCSQLVLDLILSAGGNVSAPMQSISAKMTTPRDFFEKILKPSYEAWVSDPLTEWKEKAAVSNADTMAERVFRYWKSRNASQIAGATDPSKYRTHLRENVCADFGLVWDIHDGHKHMVLSRANRQVTTSDQTGVRKMGYGQGRYGEGAYGGTDQIIVELDDGSTRALTAVMSNVMKMWEQILKRMGL